MDGQIISVSVGSAAIQARSNAPLPLPAPRRGEVRVREATMEDLPFIDQLQKRTTRQVGFMPRAQFEGKIRLGEVLIAEAERDEETKRWRDEVTEAGTARTSATSDSDTSSLRLSVSSSLSRLGYLIGSDRYFKHDDVGIIYQVNVIEQERRGLVAAMLLKAQFDRSAYGCKLYCCWCAQDLEANRFWEAMGFVPLAFRTGSATRGAKGKGRVHIFWQKRIRAGDESTPWWFPSMTSSGAVRGDRIVFPIPPDVHWSDPMPEVLPQVQETERRSDEATEGHDHKSLPAPAPSSLRRSVSPSLPQRGFSDAVRLRLLRAQVEHKVRIGELPASALAEAIEAERAAAKPAPPPRTSKKAGPKLAKKADPRFVAFARELRDRWLERAAAEPDLLLPAGKYDLTRQLPGAGEAMVERAALPRLLPSAA